LTHKVEQEPAVARRELRRAALPVEAHQQRLGLPQRQHLELERSHREERPSKVPRRPALEVEQIRPER
jgi:hypothetical protein